MTCITFIQRLFVSDAQNNEQNGQAVAIHGDLAIVNAGGRDVGANSDQGVAYIYHRSDTVWEREATLFVSDGRAFDFFSGIPNVLSHQVGISGDTAIFGASGRDSDASDNKGAVFVFTRSDNGTWMQTQKLSAFDGQNTDLFGMSVAIHDRFIVATPFSNPNVYIYQKSDVFWSFMQKVQLSDTPAVTLNSSQVAIYGGDIIVGATDAAGNGRAYILHYDGVSWVQKDKLVSGDATVGDQFGASVDIYCDYAVVGARRHNANQGAAYVFKRSDTTWVEQQKLTASDVDVASDNFGVSVAIDGRFIAVGASGHSIARGKAYLFENVGTAWVQKDGFIVTDYDGDGNSNQGFGASIALSYPYMIAGEPRGDAENYPGSDTRQGSAYVYQITCPNCITISDVSAPTNVCPDSFFDVTFSLPIDAAQISLTFANMVSDMVFDSGQGSFTIQALSVASDYVGTITAINLYNSCCSDTKQFNVSVNPRPVVSIVVVPSDEILLGSTATLTAVSPSSAYLWSTGATTSSIVVSDAGVYTVVVTNAFGCSSSDSATITTIIPSNVVDIPKDRNLTDFLRTLWLLFLGGFTILWLPLWFALMGLFFY